MWEKSEGRRAGCWSETLVADVNDLCSRFSSVCPRRIRACRLIFIVLSVRARTYFTHEQSTAPNTSARQPDHGHRTRTT